MYLFCTLAYPLTYSPYPLRLERNLDTGMENQPWLVLGYTQVHFEVR